MALKITVLCGLVAGTQAFFGPPRVPPPRRGLHGSDADGGGEERPFALPAAAVIGYGLGVGTPVVSGRVFGSRAPAAPAAASPEPRSTPGERDFSGRWRLAKSENFDAYLKSLNVSAAHRRFAAAATVDHEIEHVGPNKIQICVINRLGRKCDVVEPGGPAAASTDTYGNPNTKSAAWAPDGRTLVTTIESTVGAIVDERSLDGRDAMRVKLTSPSGVVAVRHFARRAGADAPAAAVGAAAPVAPSTTALDLARPTAAAVGLVAAGFAGGVAVGRARALEAAAAPSQS